MIKNPVKIDSLYIKDSDREIKRIRAEIRKLPENVRSLIRLGEKTIDDGMRFNEREHKGIPYSFPHGFNVFSLDENIPGDVMKYLAMLYTAGGYHNVSIVCERFTTFHKLFGKDKPIKYPNIIKFTSSR